MAIVCPDRNIPSCSATNLNISLGWFFSSVGGVRDSTLLHELAHIHTLANGVAANPIPLGLAHLYFLNSTCGTAPPYELYADVVALATLGTMRNGGYWRCSASDSRTQEALAVVRSALGGSTPSWFADTYHDANGTPDLERVWADVMDLKNSGLGFFKPVVHQLRDAFGGYCDEVVARNGLSVGDASGELTRNPWRDGGCVPSAPRSVETASPGSGKLAVSWETPDSYGASLIKGYRLQWKWGEESYSSSHEANVTGSGTGLAHTIEELVDGREYTIRVQAYNHDGDGAWSSEIKGTPGAGDETPPELVEATVDGASLTLTFGEALDESSIPAAASFAVTVAGAARGVDAVAVADTTVMLTLASAVASGETVTVGYTAPVGANAAPLKDAAGNAVAEFTDQTATNETPALPAVSIAAGTSPVTEGANAAFTLTRTGSVLAALTVTVEVTESGAVLAETSPVAVTFEAESATAALELATADDEAVEDTSTVTVTVVAGDGWTVDADADSAAVTVEDDDVAPEVTTASALAVAENETAVVTLAATDTDTDVASLAWSIPAGTAGGADADKFTVTEGGVLAFGASKDFEAPDDADGDGTYEVTVRVTDGANPVDMALEVTLADVDEVAPVLGSASVDGLTLTLTFSEALDSDSKPAAGAFAVTVAGDARTVDAVALSGSAVALTLALAVASGETVTVGLHGAGGGERHPAQGRGG